MRSGAWGLQDVVIKINGWQDYSFLDGSPELRQ